MRITAVEGVAYIAGFFDGEGCINISKSGKSGQIILRVMLVNTNPIVINIINKIYGGDVRVVQHQENWKQAYHWKASGASAREFLNDIGPYLILRRPQYEIAKRFFSTFSKPKNEKCDYKIKKCGAYPFLKQEIIDERMYCRTELGRLNKKGINVLSEARQGK